MVVPFLAVLTASTPRSHLLPAELVQFCYQLSAVSNLSHEQLGILQSMGRGQPETAAHYTASMSKKAVVIG